MPLLLDHHDDWDDMRLRARRRQVRVNCDRRCGRRTNVAKDISPTPDEEIKLSRSASRGSNAFLPDPVRFAAEPTTEPVRRKTWWVVLGATDVTHGSICLRTGNYWLLGTIR